MSYKIFGLILTVLIGFSFQGHTQYENIWAFGTRSGLDFSSGRPRPFLTNMGVYPGTEYNAFGEGSASICDAKGRLLFYTEGFYVWDKNGNVMPNGRDLLPLPNQSIKYTPSSSTSQGAVIVPMPENPGKYYLFSLTAKEAWQQRAGDLYYSIVDMALNGGLGDIVPGQKSIFVDSFQSEKMTITLGNRCNMWLLASSVSATSSKFHAYEITASGVNTTPVVSNTDLGSAAVPAGLFAVSPNGKKVIATQVGFWGNGRQGAALFDFDPNTGIFSNKIQILGRSWAYGACFSPDNKKAYVSGVNGEIFQYDLSSNNPSVIIASEFQVGTSRFSHLKLGPDDKIYFLNGDKLGTINLPNSLGAVCGYTANAVQMLPEQDMHAGLPNSVVAIPYGFEQSAQEAKASCWANVNQMTISALQVTEGWDYIWNDGKVGPQRTVDTPGLYWVKYRTPPCITHTDTFLVLFPNGVLPDITIQKSCKGAYNGKAWASTYPGDTVTYHCKWSNSRGQLLSQSDTLPNVASGNYTLRVTTLYCDTTLSFVVEEEDYKVSFDVDSIVCQGAVTNFTNTSDADFVNFRWDFSDGQQSSLQSPQHLYQYSGSYQAKLVGIGTICQDSMVKTIIVDSMFSGKFLMTPDSICTGQQITFYPQTDKTSVGLQWHFGDGLGMASDNEPNVQHAYDVPGVMRVQLHIKFRVCPDVSFSDTGYVIALPYIDLGPDSVICSKGAPVILRNKDQVMPGRDRYLWNTGDTTEQIRVTHPGTYTLTVQTTGLGCSNAESVQVKKDCYTDLPNVFTPNGDGVNDYFFPRQLLSENVSRFKMQILNRWGQSLFESSNLKGRGWDGQYNSKEQPVGVYIYIIEADMPNGQKESYSGNVTLMR